MFNIIDPTDEGNNNGDNTGFDLDIDASLGLGGMAAAKNGTQSTVGAEQENNQAIYDSYGKFTHPFDTANRYIQRRYIQFHCYFYTQRDEYEAYWVVGRNDKINGNKKRMSNEFDQELMGFHTDNQNRGIPTMEIYLFSYRDWEQILRPNDYVALRVFESYPDDPYYLNRSGDLKDYPEDRNGVRHRTLMVGLISNIQMSESPQAGRIYVITCSGLQKVLADVQLGLPKEAQWNDVNSIYDINGASNPANESFPTNGGSTSSKSESSGGAFGLSGIKGEIAKWFSSNKSMSKAQCAGIIGAVRVESDFNPKVVNSTGHRGLFQIQSGADCKGNPLGSVSDQCEAVSTFGNRVDQYKSDTTGSSSPLHCAQVWSSDVEKGGAGDQYAEYAVQYYHQMN